MNKCYQIRSPIFLHLQIKNIKAEHTDSPAYPKSDLVWRNSEVCGGCRHTCLVIQSSLDLYQQKCVTRHENAYGPTSQNHVMTLQGGQNSETHSCIRESESKGNTETREWRLS